jgi:8-oxo-dGTP pyrophosphatase MutT (NUDIX family)
MPPVLSPDAIRRSLAATRKPDNPVDVDTRDLGRRLPADYADRIAAGLRPAGVLVPIVQRRAGLTVLLTERAADLKLHAGQVSFPGGGMEPHDEDIVATALRETHEEVGIEPGLIDVAGFLHPRPTVTGYAVTPVVGLVMSTFVLSIDPLEVDTVFEVPLDYLMDAQNETHYKREFEGVTYDVTSIFYEEHDIWGATAGIIASLRKAIKV